MKKREAERERRGDLHETLLGLVEEHGVVDVRWMLGVIEGDALPKPKKKINYTSKVWRQVQEEQEKK